MVCTIQGRFQYLSGGGGQDFFGTKNVTIRNKKARRWGKFFLLKRLKIRVKINDYRLKN